MTDLVVIVPSRGRPAAAHELFRAFVDTCSAPTGLVFAIDKRDADGIYEYPFGIEGNVEAVTCWNESSTMVEALNMASASILAREPGFAMTSAPAEPFAIGFMGDDHRPRTQGWDKAYLEVLRELGTGIVYGDDMLQRRNLPTQCAMTADIVRALGFMAPPSLTHLAVDNYWLELGTKAGCIRYLPDVVVEHRHPVAGKAQWDEGYLRVNSSQMYERDLTEFARIQRESLPGDIAKVRALRSVNAGA